MRVLIVLALLLAAAPARAQSCGGAATQADLDACAGAAVRKADAQLNAAYAQIVRRLAGHAAKKKLLTAAELAWIKLRDAECAFEASGVSGGSIYPMIVSNCIATMTEQRTNKLKTYLNCPEGDLACPVPKA
jgi:uncharacterized protein YecT (DUF1311 family)